MSDSDRVVSSALLAANRILLERRQRAGVTVSAKMQATSRPIAHAEIAKLPLHLGWGSARVTAVLRVAHQQPIVHAPIQLPEASIIEEAPPQSLATTIKIYPSIALGMLRQEQTAVGRIWLLARHFDSAGSGKIRIAAFRKLIATPSAPQRVCGWRQLRNLLRQGEGVFWERDKTHLWLFSAAKTAHALGVTRLTGKPIALPVSSLLGGIGAVRAHLYASFHSGRVKETRRNGVDAMPIARETLTAVCNTSPTTQRKYEAETKLAVQQNYAIGGVVNKENAEASAWKHGAGVFTIKERNNHSVKEYLAWQLPNTYGSSHQQRPLGRQKRINRALKDLVTQGMPGNVEEAGELVVAKRYYANGKLAANARDRADGELYWHQKKGRNGRSFWYTL